MTKYEDSVPNRKVQDISDLGVKEPSDPTWCRSKTASLYRRAVSISLAYMI